MKLFYIEFAKKTRLLIFYFDQLLTNETVYLYICREMKRTTIEINKDERDELKIISIREDVNLKDLGTAAARYFIKKYKNDDADAKQILEKIKKQAA
jgi:hypothetical protein